MTDDKDARIAALEANQNRAFDSLSFLGVPKHRARSVSNGIEVLATRFRKADLAQSSTIAALEAELARVKDALRTIRKATYICTVSLQDWRHCVLEVQRVAYAAMKD